MCTADLGNYSITCVSSSGSNSEVYRGTTFTCTHNATDTDLSLDWSTDLGICAMSGNDFTCQIPTTSTASSIRISADYAGMTDEASLSIIDKEQVGQCFFDTTVGLPEEPTSKCLIGNPTEIEESESDWMWRCSGVNLPADANEEDYWSDVCTVEKEDFAITCNDGTADVIRGTSFSCTHNA